MEGLEFCISVVAIVLSYLGVVHFIAEGVHGWGGEKDVDE